MFFLRVAVIQRRNVRRTVFRNLCNVSVKTVKHRKAKIPVSFVYRTVFLSLHPFVPGHCLQEKHAVFVDFGGTVHVNAV